MRDTDLRDRYREAAARMAAVTRCKAIPPELCQQQLGGRLEAGA